MSRRALLLVNRQARQGRESFDQAVGQLREAGLEPTEEPTDQGPAGVIRGYRDRVDLVVVGGGDGTLKSAVDGLVDAHLPLGILPLGTANDLARTQGIPADLPGAGRVIAGGHTRRIDLGWVNGKHFFNVASIGLTAQITRRLTREIKVRWGVLSYPLIALQVIWNARPFRAEIRAGG